MGHKFSNRAIYSMVVVLSIMLIPLTAFGKDKKQTQITFTEKSFDFGNIREENGKVYHDFEFTNSGEETVVILNAVTTCGCTKADYPKQPLKPGEKGIITISFNPKGYGGEFIKVVTVRTINQRIKLKITGVVIPKDNQE